MVTVVVIVGGMAPTIGASNNQEVDADTAGSAVALQDTANTTVTLENQSSNGSTITVANAVLEDGGFVAIHTEELIEGSVLESQIGVSEYLEPGEHENVTVELNESIEEPQTLIAVAYQDTNDNQEYDFIESQGSADGPYTVNNQVVTDEASIGVSIDVEEPETSIVTTTEEDADEGETTIDTETEEGDEGIETTDVEDVETTDEEVVETTDVDDVETTEEDVVVETTTDVEEGVETTEEDVVETTPEEDDVETDTEEDVTDEPTTEVDGDVETTTEEETTVVDDVETTEEDVVETETEVVDEETTEEDGVEPTTEAEEETVDDTTTEDADAEEPEPAPEESFDISGVQLPEEVDAGETASVSAVITNPNDEQVTQTVDVRVDGDVVDRRTVTLDADEQVEVEFDVETETIEAGDHFISVFTRDDGELTQFAVTAPETTTETEPVETETDAEPSDPDADEGDGDDGDTETVSMEVSQLTGAEEITEGDALELTAVLQNPNDQEVTETVQIRVNGQLVRSEEVTLGPGEETNLTYTVEADEFELREGPNVASVLTDEAGDVHIISATGSEAVDTGAGETTTAEA